MPRPPILDANEASECHVLLGPVSWKTVQERCPWSLSSLRRAWSRALLTSPEVEVGEVVTTSPAHWNRICAAHRRSGTLRKASHNSRSLRNHSSHISCADASDPNGVPNNFSQRGLQTSGRLRVGKLLLRSTPVPCVASRTREDLHWRKCGKEKVRISRLRVSLRRFSCWWIHVSGAVY